MQSKECDSRQKALFFLIFVSFFFFECRDSTMSARVAKAVSEKEIIDSFPADESERGGYLFELAIFSMADFIETHTLELKFPQESSRALARAFEEGRFIKKKHMGKLALAIALKALLLAAAALMQHCKKGHHHGAYVKLVGNGAGAVQTDVNPGTGFAEQYPYDRGYDNAQDLAYNAYTY